jgi:hypothetical protein
VAAANVYFDLTRAFNTRGPAVALASGQRCRALAWDLWFDLAQATNDEDPPYTHGVVQGVTGAASALPSFDVAPFDSARGGGPPRS